MWLGKIGAVLGVVLGLCGLAQAQSNPNFQDGLTLCADVTSTFCQANQPSSSIGLNRAFQQKADYPYVGPVGGITITGVPSLGWVPVATSPTTAAWAPYAATVLADVQPGSDMGAKINAAAALLPAGGGIIDARGLVGAQTLSTAVTIPANSQLLMGPAVVTQSAVITLGQVSSLVCLPVGMGQGNNFGQTRFIQSNGANLAEMILLSGGQTTLQNCVIDGNKTNNTSSGPSVLVTSSRYYVSGLTLQNSHSDGLKILSVGMADGACCGQIFNIMSIANAGDGLNCIGSADTLIEFSQFENNTGNAGVELNNCPTTRLVNYDIGGNVIGLWVYGNTSTSLGSNGQIVGSGQFGNQSAQDILIDGSNSGSYSNLISGAYFLGSSMRASNTYAAIELHDMANGGNNLNGLSIGSTAGHTLANAIYIHGSEGIDFIGDIITVGSFGGTAFNVANDTFWGPTCEVATGLCQTGRNTVFTGNGTGYSVLSKTSGASASDQNAFGLWNPSNATFATAAMDFLSNSSPTATASIRSLRNGTGMGGFFYIYTANSGGTLTQATSWDQSQNMTAYGGITAASLPTSAGGGGLFLCVDTSGVIYKKSSCP